MDIQDLASESMRLLHESTEFELNPPIFSTPIRPLPPFPAQPPPSQPTPLVELSTLPPIRSIELFSPQIKTPETFRYQSTPWSERIPSQSSSPTLPSTTPTLADTASNTESQAHRITTEGNKLILLRVAYQFRQLYGRITMGKFWDTVAKELSRQTSTLPRKNLSRNVTKMIKDRKEFLEDLESGEQDSPSSYTEALDTWILVVDTYQQQKADEKDAQGRISGESRASAQWRLNQLSRYSDKSTLAIANKRNKRARDQEEEEEEEGDEEPEVREFNPDSTPKPPTRRRRIEQENKLDQTLINSVVKLSDYIVKKGEFEGGSKETVKDIAKEVTKETIKGVEDRLSTRINSLENGVQELLRLIRGSV